MSNYDEYMKKLKAVKLDPSRKNLKPVNPKLTFDQYLAICLKEGEALLAAEAKNPKDSVKPPASKPAALEEALGKMSDNPYIRARIQILNKMTHLARSVIEKMEKGTIDKDARYDNFVKQITVLGDKLSQ